MLNVAVAEVSLQRSGIEASVRQRVTAGVPQRWLVGTLSFVSSSELGIGNAHLLELCDGHDAGNRFLDHIDDHGFDRTRCWPLLTRSCPRGYAAAARRRDKDEDPVTAIAASMAKLPELVRG